jgi:DNA-binding transcriptional MerR regulator
MNSAEEGTVSLVDDEARISIKDAASMMGVSIDTLRRWDKDGRLAPAGRTIGGWRYYFLTDIRQLLGDLYKTTKASSLSGVSMAHHLPIKTHNLSASQRRLLKSRAEEISRLADDGNFIRISLLITDMVRILEENTVA